VCPAREVKEEGRAEPGPGDRSGRGTRPRSARAMDDKVNGRSGHKAVT
jgi:hypothetical protein